MGITNKWLTPYQRSYQSIKAKLIEALSNIKDKDGQTLVTDYSEGNILIIILDLFAALSEVLHYYIDNIGRESFLSTSRRYDSLIKHGLLVDYHSRSAIAASVDVILYRSLSSNQIGAKVNIPKGTQFSDNSGNTWLTPRDVVWHPNVTSVTVPVVQHEIYRDTELTQLVIPSEETVQIKLGDLPSGKYYENGTMELAIANESWVLVNTFAYSKPTDKHFMVVLSNGLKPIILFGDGNFGMKPKAGSKITSASYYLTKGLSGNIKSGTLLNVPSTIKSSVSDVECSNPYDAAGGSNYETFEMLREHIPLSVKTLGVAITKQDFVDLAKLVDGVNKAAVEYECGRKLIIYINPDNGTNADTERIQKVYDILSQNAPLTTWLKVKSAGRADIILDIEVTGNKSYKTSEITSQILDALYNKYSPEASEIGGSVRVSDIYALIDNLPSVDYLHIKKFYIKPWPTTLYGNKELIIGQFTLDKASTTASYYLVFTSPTAYTLRSVKGGFYKEGLVSNTTQVIDDINGFKFSLDIQDNGYKAGYRYTFTISEPNHDYEDPGFNLPIFDKESQLTLKVNEIV